MISGEPWWFLAFIFTLGGIVFIHLYKLGWVNNELSELKKYRRQLRGRTGWTSYRGMGFYHLRSFDGGVNWHLVEANKYGGIDYSLRVLGPVEVKCPGLFEHDEALRELYQLVQQGRIPTTEDGFKRVTRLLERAGFFFDEEAGCASPPMNGEQVVRGLYHLIREHSPITFSEPRFNEVREFLERAGFFFNDEALLQRPSWNGFVDGGGGIDSIES